MGPNHLGHLYPLGKNPHTLERGLTCQFLDEDEPALQNSHRLAERAFSFFRPLFSVELTSPLCLRVGFCLISVLTTLTAW